MHVFVHRLTASFPKAVIIDVEDTSLRQAREKMNKLVFGRLVEAGVEPKK